MFCLKHGTNNDVLNVDALVQVCHKFIAENTLYTSSSHVKYGMSLISIFEKKCLCSKQIQLQNKYPCTNRPSTTDIPLWHLLSPGSLRDPEISSLNGRKSSFVPDRRHTKLRNTVLEVPIMMKDSLWFKQLWIRVVCNLLWSMNIASHQI